MQTKIQVYRVESTEGEDKIFCGQATELARQAAAKSSPDKMTVIIDENEKSFKLLTEVNWSITDPDLLGTIKVGQQFDLTLTPLSFLAAKW